MGIPQKIIKFLEGNKAKYEQILHRTVYTAFDKATTLGVPQKIVGKTLVVKLDKKPAIVLIPANKNLDSKILIYLKSKLEMKAKPSSTKQKLRKIAKAKTVDASTGSASTLSSCRRVDFVKEVWMKKNLKGVKVGAIPPFGNLWRLPTFVEKSLLQNPKIIVNGGDYNWSIKISPAVLKKIIPNLVVGSFSQSRK